VTDVTSGVTTHRGDGHHLDFKTDLELAFTSQSELAPYLQRLRTVIRTLPNNRAMQAARAFHEARDACDHTDGTGRDRVQATLGKDDRWRCVYCNRALGSEGLENIPWPA
jgi:hypothetical protein